MWYLQAASGAVLCDDAHVGRVHAGADEAGQVLVLNVTHLQEHKLLSGHPTITINIPHARTTELRLDTQR